MSRAYAAFTETGLALAETLARALPGPVTRCGHGGPSLAEWTAAAFAQNEALIFVGAVGIAVRAIAPFCRSKASDPAVVVVDECGRFAVPLLSGHLGGATIWRGPSRPSAGLSRSSPRPPMPTASLPWTSGQGITTAGCWNPNASRPSAGNCWPGSRSYSGRSFPSQARFRPGCAQHQRRKLPTLP